MSTVYDHIADDEIEPEAPITASLMGRMRDNPYSIVREDILTTGSGNISKPAYATRLKIEMWGGGGNGGSTSGGGGGGAFVWVFEGDEFDALPSSIPYVVGGAAQDSTFNAVCVAKAGGNGAGSDSNGGAGGSAQWDGVTLPASQGALGGVYDTGMGSSGQAGGYGGGGGGSSGSGVTSGGNSFYGGGGGMAAAGVAGKSVYGGAGGADGQNGVAPGGGGGRGGNGARGEIRLRWYP